MIEVIVALIIKDNKYFIARRGTGDESVYGKWEFPGGKKEVNEKPEDTIIREMMEEFKIVVNNPKYICNNIYEYPNKIVNLKLYKVEYVSGDINCNFEHLEYKFVEKEDIMNYEFCPADKYFVEKIVGN